MATENTHGLNRGQNNFIGKELSKKVSRGGGQAFAPVSRELHAICNGTRLVQSCSWWLLQCTYNLTSSRRNQR